MAKTTVVPKDYRSFDAVVLLAETPAMPTGITKGRTFTNGLQQIGNSSPKIFR